LSDNFRRTLVLGAGGVLIGAGIGVALLFGLGIAPTLSGASSTAGQGDVSIGSQAPDFELAELEGPSLHLKDLRGQPVLINFWATWCVPCVTEMPLIQSAYVKSQGSFTVLGVNADEPVSDVQSFLAGMDLSFDILLDPGGKVQNLYRLRGYPTSYFVDKDGIIRAIQIGQLSESQLNRYLSQVGVQIR
jgi:cytochrome c biogenesis protein CcmG/thiol:disulfide interchange protein DsbE